ncbi:hypothetical protein [Flavobacterium sp.]|jgi:hypothetical protein|uniref:hypothetical protein n=1 Tax=Flavobacterium sp. TaxID=239 RepID=UPI0037BFDCB5
MGNVRIKVDVFGGTAPVPIFIFIDKVNSNDDTRIKRNGSFDESFTIAGGEYNVIVSGENAIGGSTNVEVEYTDNNGITKTKRYSMTNPIYSKIFKVFI